MRLDSFSQSLMSCEQYFLGVGLTVAHVPSCPGGWQLSGPRGAGARSFPLFVCQQNVCYLSLKI